MDFPNYLGNLSINNDEWQQQRISFWVWFGCPGNEKIFTFGTRKVDTWVRFDFWRVGYYFRKIIIAKAILWDTYICVLGHVRHVCRRFIKKTGFLLKDFIYMSVAMLSPFKISSSIPKIILEFWGQLVAISVIFRKGKRSNGGGHYCHSIIIVFRPKMSRVCNEVCAIGLWRCGIVPRSSNELCLIFLIDY